MGYSFKADCCWISSESFIPHTPTIESTNPLNVLLYDYSWELYFKHFYFSCFKVETLTISSQTFLSILKFLLLLLQLSLASYLCTLSPSQRRITNHDDSSNLCEGPEPLTGSDSVHHPVKRLLSGASRALHWPSMWPVLDNLLTYLGLVSCFSSTNRDLFVSIFCFLSAINKTFSTSIKHFFEGDLRVEILLVEESSAGNWD